MGSVRTILASLFTALGGLFLLAMTAGVGLALYLATAPDSESAPAEADAVAERPLLRPQSSTTSPQPGLIRVASTSFAMALDALPAPHDRRDRIRHLQRALARAGCYDGPISGIWSDASKEAMRGFLRSANAELPVDSPDETLVALVESNDSATCAARRNIQTGALGSSAPIPAAEPVHVEEPAPTLLGRAWAPAGMLTAAAENMKPADPPKATTVPPAVTQPTQVAEATAESENAPTSEAPNMPQPQSSSTAHFEGGSPLPAVQPIDREPVAPRETSEPKRVESPKTKKSKTARRRTGKHEDVQTTISKGFDSLQRSIASIF